MPDDERRAVDYDEVAPAYDSRYARHGYSGVEEVLRRFVGVAPRVLEVGCGTGHWLELLRAAGRAVAGLDASREMLARASARLPGAELVHGRAETLPWRDGAFDRVFCINALHHFDDARAFVADARRVLRPGGALLAVGLDPHTGLDRWWIYDAFEGTLERDLARYPAASSIRRWMEDAGLCEATTALAEHLPGSVTVREALRIGYLDKASTSQLTLLSDDEYRRGRDALERDPDAELRADLRLWATSARKPG